MQMRQLDSADAGPFCYGQSREKTYAANGMLNKLSNHLNIRLSGNNA
jgi:hypothetical protein